MGTSLQYKSMMKFLLFLCFLVNLTFVGSERLHELHQIEGRVTDVFFTSISTTYIEATIDTDFGNHVFYKLNPENGLKYIEDINGTFSSFLGVNDNFYSFEHETIGKTNVFIGKGTFGRLKPDSDDFEYLFRFDCPEDPADYKNFVDRSDNVIFNTKAGVSFWKPGLRLPVLIQKSKRLRCL